MLFLYVIPLLFYRYEIINYYIHLECYQYTTYIVHNIRVVLLLLIRYLYDSITHFIRYYLYQITFEFAGKEPIYLFTYNITQYILYCASFSVEKNHVHNSVLRSKTIPNPEKTAQRMKCCQNISTR